MIGAEFLTPKYNITFSAKGHDGFKRHKNDRYIDLCAIRQEPEESIVFFGGKDYVQLFCDLTHLFKCRKVVFYNAKCPPLATGCELRKFDTIIKTNWHYECAKQFIAGKIKI